MFKTSKIQSYLSATVFVCTMLANVAGQDEDLEVLRQRAFPKPKHCCIVMIRARYEDGRHVSKGQTRCLSWEWHSWREQGYEEEPIADELGEVWLRQDSWGGTAWLSWEPFEDTCEARDGKGKFGRATIRWTKGNHTFYIIIK